MKQATIDKLTFNPYLFKHIGDAFIQQGMEEIGEAFNRFFDGFMQLPDDEQKSFIQAFIEPILENYLKIIVAVPHPYKIKQLPFNPDYFKHLGEALIAIGMEDGGRDLKKLFTIYTEANDALQQTIADVFLPYFLTIASLPTPYTPKSLYVGDSDEPDS